MRTLGETTERRVVHVGGEESIEVHGLPDPRDIGVVGELHRIEIRQ